MANNERQPEQLERLLCAVYRARSGPELGPAWRQGVIRHIRSLTGPAATERLGFGLDQLVWRTATLAAVLAVVAALSVGVLVWTTQETETLLGEEFEIAALFND